MSTLRFFEDLPELGHFSDVADRAAYREAPDDWLVIITDVQGSTRSIEQGRYKEVNAVGVASIVALQNACKPISLPFTFGGDGATLLAPASHGDRIRKALQGIRSHARKFGLDMRGGIVAIRELRESGHEVRVARYAPTPNVSLAMFAGSGVTEAEKWIKDPERGTAYCVDDNPSSRADITGFECRWSAIQPQRDRIISLLVMAFGNEAERTQTYRRTIDRIEQILKGDGRPVSLETMTLATDLTAFNAETKLRFGGGFVAAIGRIAIAVQTAIGRHSMVSGRRLFGFDGPRYLEDTILQTDFRKFDETLRMVLDVRDEELESIEQTLSAEMNEGHLVYGIHSSATALITCHVSDREGGHVHFVDGSDGGYALAAKTLKKHLAKHAEST